MTAPTRSRTAALAAALLLATAAGACGGEEERPGVARNTPTEGQRDAQPSEQPAPAGQAGNTLRIQVNDGEPAGGPKELSVEKGEPVTVTVESDKPARIHLHGYEVFMEAKPGAPAVFDFGADIEGLFDMEVEGSGTKILELEVRP